MYSCNAAYFQDNWNKFDFVMVVSSVVSMVLDLADGSAFPALAQLRVLRVLRLLRLIPKMKGLKWVAAMLVQLHMTLPGVHLLYVQALFYRPADGSGAGAVAVLPSIGRRT